MNQITSVVFFSSLFMIVYVYLGYPAVTGVIAILLNRRVKKGHYEPKVTIVIAAHNEDQQIEKTVNNKLELDYPAEKLEIIVISDGSTDRTEQIIKSFENREVKPICQNPRGGKTSVLNLGTRHATGEILVFSDANSIWAKDVLKHLVQNFSDPQVGYVTGKMIYTSLDGNIIGDGCSTYMRYENMLRELETRTGSIVGVDGGIDAIRKELYKPMNHDQLPDFVLPLQVVLQGYRVVYESEAVLKEPSLRKADDEYKMRVRVSLRAFWALKDMRKLLSIRKYKLYAYQLWSHKVLRYLVFIFLITAYLSNIILWHQSSFYKFCFVLQNLLYLGAVLSPFFEKMKIKSRVLRLLYYFVLINLASAHAFIKYLRGQKVVVWEPRKG